MSTEATEHIVTDNTTPKGNVLVRFDDQETAVDAILNVLLFYNRLYESIF